MPDNNPVKGMLKAGSAPKPGAPAEPVSSEVKEYISNGMQLIHGKQMQGEIRKALKGESQEDVKGLANATVRVINQLDTSNPGKPVDDEVKWKAASVFMDQLVEIGTRFELLKIDAEGIKAAAGQAVSLYMEQGLKSGKITEEQLRDAYKFIQTQNPDKPALFDSNETPGRNKNSTPIPVSSPGPDQPAPSQGTATGALAKAAPEGA